jgi:uncharacterized protein HemX
VEPPAEAPVAEEPPADRELAAPAEAVADPSPAVPPTTPPEPADSFLEPAAPNTGGAGMLLLVVLVIVVVVAALMFMAGKRGDDQLRSRLEAREAQLSSIGQANAQAARQQALQVAAKTQESNLGLAREHLAQVRVTLATMRSAAGDEDEARLTRLANAEAACRKAQEALLLTAPQSQAQLEAAVRALVKSLEAVDPGETSAGGVSR